MAQSFSRHRTELPLPVTPRETALLNFYRASHLHAGLILGQMVRRTRDPGLILSVTRHSAEEVMHAQMWTETIMVIGGRPSPVGDTYQARYAEVVGTPRTVLDVLTLTHVFERRMYRHFTVHAALAGVHPAVSTTLRRTLEDERAHLSWVKAWLDEQAKERRNAVREAMQRYVTADQRIYDKISTEYQLCS